VPGQFDGSRSVAAAGGLLEAVQQILSVTTVADTDLVEERLGVAVRDPLAGPIEPSTLDQSS